MKKKKKSKFKAYFEVISMIVIMLFAFGCSRDSSNIKPDLMWETELTSEPAYMMIEKDKLFVCTHSGKLLIIDKKSGAIKSKYDLGNELDIESGCVSMDIHNDLLLMNFNSRLLVFDYIKENVVLNYKTTDSFVKQVKSKVIIQDKTVIYSDIIDHFIRAIDIETGSIVWERKADDEKSYELYRYEDKLLFKHGRSRDFHEFDLTDGKVETVYINSDKEVIDDEVIPYRIPSYDVKDDKMNLWLRQNSSNPYKIGLRNDLYRFYDESLRFYGDDSIMDWNFKFKRDVRTSVDLGRYLALNMIESILFFDKDNKVMVGEIKYNVASFPYILVEDNILYLPSKENKVSAYDLSLLNNN